MRTLLRLAISALALVALTTLASAQVDHAPVRVSVPFDFIAGGTALPAGDYTLRSLSADMELISGKGGRIATFAPANLQGPAGSTGLLIFHQYGDRFFLAEVWPSGSTIGRLVGGSGTLKRARETQIARRVTVIAGGSR